MLVEASVLLLRDLFFFHCALGVLAVCCWRWVTAGAPHPGPLELSLELCRGNAWEWVAVGAGTDPLQETSPSVLGTEVAS